VPPVDSIAPARDQLLRAQWCRRQSPASVRGFHLGRWQLESGWSLDPWGDRAAGSFCQRLSEQAHGAQSTGPLACDIDVIFSTLL
jgi:hypothetical protein